MTKPIFDTNLPCAKNMGRKEGNMKKYRMQVLKKKIEGKAAEETAAEITGRKGVGEFLREEDGMGTVEIILIVVVLISLVIIFKRQLTSLVNTVFDKINETAGSI